MAPLFELPTTVSELAINMLAFQDLLVELDEEDQEDVWVTLDTFWENLHELSDQVQMIFRHIGKEWQGLDCGRANDGMKRKIPKPHAYDGFRDAQLENFIFNMDQYFLLVNPETKEEKTAMAVMYFYGDPKFWW